MTFRIEIRGVDKLVAKLDTLQAAKLLKPWVEAALLDAKGFIAQYPPSTDANVPFQRRWYERGYGPKWMRKDGTVNGSHTSEVLGRSWTTRTTDGGLGGIVGTKATYARAVQDRDKQAAFHARRGWRTVQDWVEQRGDVVKGWIEKRIQQIIGG